MKKYLFYLLMSISCLVYSGDYYVSTEGNDANSGTIEKPWKSLQYAADHAPKGATVYVFGGTYVEPITIKREVHFKNFAKEKPIITGSGSELISVKSNGVIINGFELFGLNQPQAAAIRVGNTVYDIFLLNNEIHDINGEGGSAIVVFGTEESNPTSSVTIQGNTIHHCDLGSGAAISISGNVSLCNTINNTLHDITGLGIAYVSTLPKQEHYGGVKNVVCQGNNISNIELNKDDAYSIGLLIEGASDFEVVQNLISTCDLGMVVTALNEGLTTSNIQVGDNYIYDHRKTGLMLGGHFIDAGLVTNCEFLQNAFYSNGSVDNSLGQIWIGSAKDCKIEKNEIKPLSNSLAIFAEGSCCRTSLDYNTYIGGAEDFIWKWNNQTYKGLKAFQKGTGQEKHAHVSR